MLSAPIAGLMAGLVLIVMSGWGYVDASNKSLTILIPAFAGVALLLCYPGLKAQNKIAAHVAVFVAALIFLALFMPMSGAIARGDSLAASRVGAMLGATFVALIAFVRSFIAARKARAEG